VQAFAHLFADTYGIRWTAGVSSSQWRLFIHLSKD